MKEITKDSFFCTMLVSLLMMITGLIFCSFICGAIVMLVWNALMPSLGIITLSYWQSFGLYFLCGLLFKGGNSKLEYNTHEIEEGA